MTRPTKPSDARLSSACEAILSDLRRVHPGSLTSVVLQNEHGPAAKSRIGDLRKQGWQIETDESEGVASYKLASLTRSVPDPVLAGWTLRLGEQTGWSVRTHREAEQNGVLSVEALERIQQALSALAQELVAQELGHSVKPSKPVPPPVQVAPAPKMMMPDGLDLLSALWED